MTENKSTRNLKFDFVRDDDFIEYFLFPKLNDNNRLNKIELENYLQNILSDIDNFIQKENYIWHKDEFKLTIRTCHSQMLLLDDNNETKVELPPHLYGISHYGENIDDEWFIVHLIFELTKKYENLIGRVIDSDGEFLIIEAAEFLPKWANPESCEQRVFIHEGHLQLVQNSPSNSLSILPISTGVSKIWQNPTLYKVKSDIKNIIDERLKNFQNDMWKKQMIHRQIIRVPLAVASILKQRPNLIAHACRAFCERDSIDIKSLRAMRFFPPENRVKINVNFTRCLYAMITHQKFVPDWRVGWNLPAHGTEEYKEDLLGIKVACGFEILASQAKNDEDDDLDKDWKIYLERLTEKGYFKENIEGSQQYMSLLKEAKEFYCENLKRFRTRPIVGKEIIDMIKNLDNSVQYDENNLGPSDDDSWINISPEELEEMLTKKYGTRKLFNVNGEANASEFTSNIEQFLEMKSEFDGVEIPEKIPEKPKRGIKKNESMRRAMRCDDDGSPSDYSIDLPKNSEKSIKSRKNKSDANDSSDKINFDPDSFSTHVKNFLDFVIPEDNWESNSDMDDYEDDDNLEKNIDDMSSHEKLNIESDIKKYMDQMDKELSKTVVGETFKQSRSGGDGGGSEDDFDDIETFKPINIDVNTLKNMIDSYKSQLGGAGPSSNLLNSMGVGFRDTSTNGEANLTDSKDLSETQV